MPGSAKKKSEVSTGKTTQVVALHHKSKYMIKKCKDLKNAQEMLDALSSEEAKDTVIVQFDGEEAFKSKQHETKIDGLLHTNSMLAAKIQRLESPDKSTTGGSDSTGKQPSLLQTMYGVTGTKVASPRVVTPVKAHMGRSAFMSNVPAWDTIEKVKLSDSQGSRNGTSSSGSRLLETMNNNYAVEGMSLNIYLFNKTPADSPADIIMYDYVDTLKQHVHWCHRPSVWGDIFRADKGLDPSQRELNDFHHCNRSCVQRKQKQGLSVPKKIKVKGAKSDYLVDAVSLYCPINKGLEMEQVKELVVSNWASFPSSTSIQQVYYTAMSKKSSSVTLLNEVKPLIAVRGFNTVNPDAQYWNRMKGALNVVNVKVEQKDCLSDLFLDKDIEMILQLLFPDQIDETNFGDVWNLPPAIKEFVGPIF